MATIAIRVSDEEKAALEAIAEARGSSLSDFVRPSVLRLQQGADPDDGLGGGSAGRRRAAEPTAYSPKERRMLLLLHRLHAAIGGPDADFHREQIEILESGFELEYDLSADMSLSGSVPRDDCLIVRDILNMFRILGDSADAIEKTGDIMSTRLRHLLKFNGFDGNDRREMGMGVYADFLFGQNKWTESAPAEGKNSHSSHMPMLDRYQRMLVIFNDEQARLSGGDYLLAAAALDKIAAA